MLQSGHIQLMQPNKALIPGRQQEAFHSTLPSRFFILGNHIFYHYLVTHSL